MQVILLEKVHNLGNLGDKIKVKSGYGRNYLIPYGKASPATVENIAKFEQKRAELEKKAHEAFVVAQARAEKFMDLVVTIRAKAGDEGKLFGSIAAKDIVHALIATDPQISKNEILLPNGVIRLLGEHDVELMFHSDIRATIKLNILPEAAK